MMISIGVIKKHPYASLEANDAACSGQAASASPRSKIQQDQQNKKENTNKCFISRRLISAKDKYMKEN